METELFYTNSAYPTFLSKKNIWEHLLNNYEGRRYTWWNNINFKNNRIYKNFFKIYEKERLYDLIGILLKILLRLLISPFRFFVTWLYFIDISWTLHTLKTKEGIKELKFLRTYELVTSYRIFSLLLPLEFKNFIIRNKDNVYEDYPSGKSLLYLNNITSIYMYFISHIFMLPYYVAFRRWENIIFLSSSYRCMYNRVSILLPFDEYAYRINNNIPHDISKVKQLFRKKKTSKILRGLLILIYIIFEHVWVLENFYSTLSSFLKKPGTSNIIPSQHIYESDKFPTIHEPLKVGFRGICEGIYNIYRYKSDFRSVTSFCLTGFITRSMPDTLNKHLTPVLVSDSNKGFYVLRPLEALSQGENISFYYYNLYSHVKAIDYLSLIFLEK